MLNFISSDKYFFSEIYYTLVQLKDCLKQNEELHGVLVRMRMEQANMISSGGRENLGSSTERYSNGINEIDSRMHTTEIISLKVSF